LISKQLLKSKRYKQALEVPFFILCRFCSLGFILYRICYYLSIYIYMLTDITMDGKSKQLSHNAGASCFNDGIDC
jgi:hypothetical protein